MEILERNDEWWGYKVPCGVILRGKSRLLAGMMAGL